jgi:hypothetical protein
VTSRKLAVVSSRHKAERTASAQAAAVA